MTPFLAWLQRLLPPIRSGIDENNRLIRVNSFRFLDGGGQPLLIKIGSAAVENNSSQLSAGGVVPAGGGARETKIRRIRLGQHVVHEFHIRINFVLTEPGLCQFQFAHETLDSWTPGKPVY